MNVIIDCPTDFLSLKAFMKKHNISESEDPDCIIVNPGTDEYLDEKYFSNFENLKVVGTPSTGVNHIDTKYLEGRNIKTFCLLDDRIGLESITASAEFTWLHIMNAFRKFNLALEYVGDWRDDENEHFLRSNELSGKNILIIGLGRIGRKIKKYANAFEMNVDWYDPYIDVTSKNHIGSLRDLSKYDVISINCYLTDETTGMIDKRLLSTTKSNALIVNTSRGEVVKEDDICTLIKNGKIIYSCDVLCNEQNVEKLKESELFKLNGQYDNLTITPHVAGATIESQTKALESIIKLCKKYLS
tara:strand:- start:10170 stop:11072 length:903 start_codon:yes stop_codon:yes gene_type:complete